MQELDFLQDLALVMCIAGVVTVLFHRLKQPVVLGYILAGVILGPHTPTYVFISDEHTIHLMSELGVIFLMFSLGLEFSLRKLRRVGGSAFIVALVEILLMLWIGHEIGMLFHWGQMNSIFLGALISISSTTIIAKALDELGKRKEKFAALIFGVLIVEDILAILLLALLSGYAATGSFGARDLAWTSGKIGLFLVSVLVIGLLVVPRLLDSIARFNSNEMLLVAVLGLCFGVSLVTVKMGYSVALGAFLIGAVMAESRYIVTIEHLVQPVRDMFSAVFFVSIGLLIDPAVIAQYWLPIAVVTLVVVAGKVVACSFGAFVTGNGVRASLRVGMSMAQIGEFSFIIAGLGLSLKVTDDFLYPVAVAVSVLTTLLTPYLIRSSDWLVGWFERTTPQAVQASLDHYSQWARSRQKPRSAGPSVAGLFNRMLAWIAFNLILVIAIFAGAALTLENELLPAALIPGGEEGQQVVAWLLALTLSLPLLVAVIRKIRAAALLMADLAVAGSAGGEKTILHATVRGILTVAALVAVVMLLLLLSSLILPPSNLLIGLTVLVLAGGFLLRDRLGRFHNRAHIALVQTFEHAADDRHEAGPMRPEGFAGVTVETVEIVPNARAAGRLISEMQLRTRTGASAVGIQRGAITITNPRIDEELRVGDQVLLIGRVEELAEARALLTEPH